MAVDLSGSGEELFWFVFHGQPYADYRGSGVRHRRLGPSTKSRNLYERGRELGAAHISELLGHQPQHREQDQRTDRQQDKEQQQPDHGPEQPRCGPDAQEER